MRVRLRVRVRVSARVRVGGRAPWAADMTQEHACGCLRELAPVDVDANHHIDEDCRQLSPACSHVLATRIMRGMIRRRTALGSRNLGQVRTHFLESHKIYELEWGLGFPQQNTAPRATDGEIKHDVAPY